MTTLCPPNTDKPQANKDFRTAKTQKTQSFFIFLLCALRVFAVNFRANSTLFRYQYENQNPFC